MRPLIRSKSCFRTLSYVMLSEAAGEVETSPGKVPCEKGAEERDLV